MSKSEKLKELKTLPFHFDEKEGGEPSSPISFSFFKETLDKLEQEVNQKTTDLLETNRELVKEIAERRHTEEKLKKAKEKAEEAARLRDKFVSLVAHDLRSPFCSIIGFLNILLADTKEPLHPNHKRTIERVIKNSNTLLKMIEEVLNLTRIKTGNIKPQKKFIDGHSIVRLVYDNLSYLANEKGIRLVNEIPAGTRLYADQVLFSEVVMNLISNAIKFSNRNEEIVSCLPPDSRTAISVKDAGVGIDKERLPKLFSPEEKTTTTGTAGEKGTGFGLPLCFDIMQAHDGILRATSEKGKGSVFTAYLPMTRPAILFVDDDSQEFSQFKEVLGDLGADFTHAQNGADAIALLKDKERKFHLILTDVFMPVMDGFEFLKRVRQEYRFKSTPVIVLTSSSDLAVRETAFQLGANDFVSKSAIHDELIPRVKRFII